MENEYLYVLWVLKDTQCRIVAIYANGNQALQAGAKLIDESTFVTLVPFVK